MLIIHTQIIVNKNINKQLCKYRKSLKNLNSKDSINKYNWSLNRNIDDKTQKTWKDRRIPAFIFLISSMKDKMVRIVQNPKIISQWYSNIPSKKKTIRVENKRSGININPAPLGLGVLWLLLSVGKSSKLWFLKCFNDPFNIIEVTRYKVIIIIKLILN